MTYNAKDLCESLHCTYIHTSPIEKIPKISSSLRKCIKKRFVTKRTTRNYSLVLQVASYSGKHHPATVVLLAFALREGKCCS